MQLFLYGSDIFLNCSLVRNSVFFFFFLLFFIREYIRTTGGKLREIENCKNYAINNVNNYNAKYILLFSLFK